MNVCNNILSTLADVINRRTTSAECCFVVKRLQSYEYLAKEQRNSAKKVGR